MSVVVLCPGAGRRLQKNGEISRELCAFGPAGLVLIENVRCANAETAPETSHSRFTTDMLRIQMIQYFAPVPSEPVGLHRSVEVHDAIVRRNNIVRPGTCQVR